MPPRKLLAGRSGLLEHAQDFVAAHPAQVLNLVYALGGADMMRSGIKRGEYWDAASGALVTSGALSGLLLKENHDPAKHHADTRLGHAIDWAEEKPLRVSGLFFAANNATMAAGAFKQMRANPAEKSYLFKFLTVASYLFANAMLGLSSKGTPEAKDGNQRLLEALADRTALVVAGQPLPLQEALIEQVSGFLAGQPEAKFSASDLSAMLHKKLLEVAVTKEADKSWQSRVLASPASGLTSIS